MTVRERVRALRFYYKAGSLDLYRQAFTDHLHAWWFPFLGSERFAPRSGLPPVTVPRKYWTMLATACRLVLIDAHPTWSEETLTVSFRNLRFVAPPTSKLLPLGLKGIFLDDVFKIGSEELAGKTIVDVGAYIGDSSIAFAMHGARVHAFEPLPDFQQYLRENARLNHLEDQITVHPVGLSDTTHRVRGGEEIEKLASRGHGRTDPGDGGSCQDSTQGILLVDAVDYMQTHGIGRVDILKLNCEGCEYTLFRDAVLIQHLRPRRIILEYHQGGEGLARFFLEQGYAVDWSNHVHPKGLMFVTRSAGGAARRH